jgi:hypothetical protein
MYQFEHESFWSFFVRYGDSLSYGHNLEKWQICLNLYKGLNSETREYIEGFYNYVFLDQSPVLCLHFFKWVAKTGFSKEYPTLPPLEVPHAYPLSTDYDGIPEGTELEKTWSVNQFERAFEERLESHDHDLDSPHPIISTPPSLDDQCSCVDAPPTGEVCDEVPCAPHHDEPLTYVHDHPTSEPDDLEVDLPVIEESQVHTLVVPSVESHHTPLCHHEKLPIVHVHAHLDACVAMPLASLPPPFVHSSPDFSSCYGKSVFVVFLPLFFLLSLFHSPTSAVVGSEFDKLLRSLTRYHIVSRV